MTPTPETKNEAPLWAVEEAREMLLKVRGVDAFTAVEIAGQALARVRSQAQEEAAKECRRYAHSGSVSMMRRQVAYACENRVRALKEKDPEA